MRNKIVIVSVFLLSLFFVGCSTSGQYAANPEEAYQAAIVEASTPDASWVVTNLVSITESNNSLTWRGESGSKEVLVVTWTNWDGYEAGAWNMGDYNAWVTVASDVQNVCINYAGDYVLRLEELLGLPPYNGYEYFVEMWVDPDDLFRPTRDPDVTTATATLDWPSDVSEVHREWFENIIDTTYGTDGFPFTQLGYTYDWGNPWSIEGLSEFVIEKDVDVSITQIYTNAEYCRPGYTDYTK